MTLMWRRVTLFPQTQRQEPARIRETRSRFWSAEEKLGRQYLSTGCVGMTESEAKLALAKFSSVTVVSEQNSNVTQGEVFEQSLEAYSYVSPDEPITIKVSSGDTAPTPSPTPAASTGTGDTSGPGNVHRSWLHRRDIKTE